jgi:hypothetical protein
MRSAAAKRDIVCDSTTTKREMLQKGCRGFGRTCDIIPLIIVWP